MDIVNGLTAENRKAIAWVANQIELHPARYDQATWGQLIEPAGAQVTPNDVIGCGTAQCIAGWGYQYVLTEGDRIHSPFDRQQDPRERRREAGRALGIPGHDRNTVFLGFRIMSADRAALILRAAIEFGWTAAIVLACDMGVSMGCGLCGPRLHGLTRKGEGHDHYQHVLDWAAWQ